MDIFIELSLIVVIATLLAGVMRVLKQPLIMGHIITGLIVGPQILNVVHSQETLEAFAKFGIAILLFIVGIGLSPKIIKDVGKVAVVTGIGQIAFTTLFGFLITRAFGYDTISSLYIAAALTFSSTIIILKILSDKHDLEKLYGRISVGFLLVQDVVATMILILAASFSHSDNITLTMSITLIKGILVTSAFALFAYYVLPTLEDFFAKSQEFLFIFSIGWGLGLATIYEVFGFSIEIGALVAGVTLSVSPYAKEIESKLKPLRDFFIIMFFVFLGLGMGFENIRPVMGQAAVFSAFVLFGNPLIVLILMGLMGYNKKTSFLAGLTVAQISEFSLILVLLGVELGHVNNQVLSLVTLVGLITIAGSTYMMIYSDVIYPKISRFLSLFEKKKPIKETGFLGAFDVILFGCNRVGYDFLQLFEKMKHNFLVVDFDPTIIADLKRKKVNVVYGDAEDSDFLDEINLEQAKMVVSTVHDLDTNLFILQKLQHKTKEIIIILISYDIKEALMLYERGATYVILPHFIGGHFAAMLAAEHWLHFDKFHNEREKHIAYLEERQKLGHKHPDKEI